MEVFARVLATKFVNPRTGQLHRYIADNYQTVPSIIMQDIHQCKPINQSILAVGRLYRGEKSNELGNIVRILSGNILPGSSLFSARTGEEITIDDIFIYRGRREVQIDDLSAGQIGGIITHPKLVPGDYLTQHSQSIGLTKDIEYIQDPVVAMGIEPIDISQLDDLVTELEKMTSIIPGVHFELNSDTGEMLISGVGTLQLDVLVEDLIDSGFEIEKSEPMVLNYAIPRKTKSSIFPEIKGSRVETGHVKDLRTPGNYYSKVKDSHQNKFICVPEVPPEFLKGLFEVFKQQVRVVPNLNVRSKFFGIILKSIDMGKSLSYEDGMIFGSKLINKCMKSSEISIHAPYYKTRIYLPELYVGKVINELQKGQVKIENIQYEEGDAVIICLIDVKFGFRLADILRKISDGNAFWDYEKIMYLQKKG